MAAKPNSLVSNEALAKYELKRDTIIREQNVKGKRLRAYDRELWTIRGVALYKIDMQCLLKV